MIALTNNKPPGRYYAGDEHVPPDWYLVAAEAARYLKVSRNWFYHRFRADLLAYKLPTFSARRKFYRFADIQRVAALRPEQESESNGN